MFKEGKGYFGLIAAFFMSGTALCLDLLIPLGVAIGILHIVPITFSFKSRHVPSTFLLGIIGTIFTLLGFFFSPDGGELWKVVFNRSLAILAIWVTTGGMIMYIKLLSLQENKGEEFRRKKERYRNIIENAHEVFVIVNLQGIIKYISPNVHHVLGFDVQELEGSLFEELVDRQDRDLFKEMVSEIVKQNDINAKSNIEYRFKHKIKDRVTILSTIQIFKTSYAVETEILLSMEDVTNQRKTKEQVRKLSLAVNQSSNIFIITDTQGRIEYVNKKFTEVTGYTFEEVKNNSPRILNSGHQSKEYYTDLWKTILAGNIWHGEFKNKTKGGEYYWEKCTITPIRNECGKVVNMLAIKEVITETRNLEDKLRETLVENESISIINKFRSKELNNVLEKLIETDRRLHETLELTKLATWEYDIYSENMNFSESWKGQLGFNENELKDRFETWLMRLHPDEIEKVESKLSAYLENPVGVYSDEYRILNKNGDYIMVKSTASVLKNKEGMPYKVFGVQSRIN